MLRELRNAAILGKPVGSGNACGEAQVVRRLIDAPEPASARSPQDMVLFLRAPRLRQRPRDLLGERFRFIQGEGAGGPGDVRIAAIDHDRARPVGEGDGVAAWQRDDGEGKARVGHARA